MTRSTVRSHKEGARDRAAAARLAAQQAEHRRRVRLVIVSVTAVVAVIVGFVLVAAVTGGSGSSDAAGPARSAAAEAQLAAAVPESVLATVGKGTAASGFKQVGDPPLTAGGKPKVLYIGAEFCPYCAAERWALVQALSRFGTFHGLTAGHSSPTDKYPNTQTFNFHGATYSSDYLTFAGRELQTIDGKPLDKATAEEAALWHRYTGVGSYPFVDIGGKYVSTTPTLDTAVLQGLMLNEIAMALSDPSSPVAQAVDGAANVITATICDVTANQPANVCTAKSVAAVRGK